MRRPRAGAGYTLLALILAAGNGVAKTDPPDPPLASYKEAVLVGIEMTLNDEFDLASALYDSLERAEPTRPEGILGQGMVLYYKSLLLKKGKRLHKQTHKLLDRGAEVAEDWVDEYGESAEMYFWLGSAQALKASLHVFQRDFLDGVMAGLEAREFLKASVELDPDLVDARFGLAFTEYMAARQPRFLGLVSRLLSLPTGNRAGSLAEIERVIQEGMYSRSIAKMTRAYLELYFERRPRSAMEMFHELHLQYPGSLDYRTRYLDCMLALTITGQANYWTALADSTLSIEMLARNRDWELEDWLRIKLLFIGGYGFFLKGDYDRSRVRLESFHAEAHGKNWINGPTHLVLGKIADLDSEREEALLHYKEVLKADNIWDSHKEAQKLLSEPFAGEEPESRPMDTETRYPHNP